jgi:hypothetical protein
MARRRTSAEQEAKVAAAAKLAASSSVESLARRAEFNASESGAKNLLGKQELVDAVSSGRVKLSDIERDRLPEPYTGASRRPRSRPPSMKRQASGRPC